MPANAEKLEGETCKSKGESGDYEGVQRVYTWQQVAEHNTEDSCWVIFDDNVYDISSVGSSNPIDSLLTVFSMPSGCLCIPEDVTCSCCHRDVILLI